MGIGHGFGASWGSIGQTFAHGIAQGGLSELAGGDFRSGFLGGMIGHTAGSWSRGAFKGTSANAVIGRTMAAAIAGGASAKLGGGKFANGAMTGAFAHLFNNEANRLSARERHWRRNEINNNDANVPSDLAAARADPNFREMSSERSIYHRMGSNGKDNLKFISSDGHYEAVYNAKSGALVTDVVNRGTYNYASPDNGFSHFAKDVLPYWRWGNGPSDPTTMWQRVTGSY
uniref:Uncharacterized protein n=1 Tax=Candidatus Kentrum sp. UNK TaxID=2126344 RepID=A0A451ARI8_9GAMM|nr:MAG: hypothetical protein BECKUNK1418G_GA0071005_12573 [Candidatus Kentron sp. UNK]VFK73687.1 MAG: hypothetical protein BECKUNK1418H_GA0071006_12523 [Candidatus Kentron sp. UNK]